jgi:hypothetical protein
MTKSALAVGLIMLVGGIGCSGNPQATGQPAATASPQNVASQNAAQESIKSAVLENERKIWEGFKAKNANAVGALLADDIQVVTSDGRFNKAAFLRIVPQLPNITSYTISNATVISPGKDVAILTYDSQYVTKDPQLMRHSAFQTTVWVSRAGNWVAVFNQETSR